MNEVQIKEYVEGQIEYHCDEFGLQREEVIDIVMKNIVIQFFKDLIDEKDFVCCGNYLGYDIDLNKIKEGKMAYKKEKNRR